jgi:N-acetylglucosaminyldiphosphoundecaprenol N-acetyl-beta-D-mannosaminyltransferase
MDNSYLNAAPIALLGVPFDNITTAETVQRIEQMVASRQPHYLVTANVDFLVQGLRDVELHRILMDAHLVLCDGMPLVWASHLLGNPLPERVAGSDLVPLLIEAAAKKNYRIFFLGGTPESTEQAVDNLRKKYPDLTIAGHYSPPFADLLEMDHADICRRIRDAHPDLLFVSFGCPKQEKWITMHYRSLGVPVSVGVGATIDFLAGRVRRAPRWMQLTCTEWIFRLIQEPRRLFKRYFFDLWIFLHAISQQWRQMQWKGRHERAEENGFAIKARKNWKRIWLGPRLDLETARENGILCGEALAGSRHCLFDLSGVRFVDSTGMGLLIRLHKQARIARRQLILFQPSRSVMAALKLMRLTDFFHIANDMIRATHLMEAAEADLPVTYHPNYFPSKPSIFWQGELTADNAGQVWNSTRQHMMAHQKNGGQFLIDLSALEFIDSTGVGVMLRTRNNGLQQGIKVVFTGAQPNVRNVLEISRAESILSGVNE